MLEKGYQNKHKYYYVGDNVEAKPESISDELVRFTYKFPNNSVHHLNMFPLKKEYTQSLLKQAGFQSVKTYGDLQKTYKQDEPDFFIHVAEK